MYERFLKRVFDVILSLLLMVALSWLFVVIALSYLLNGQRKIFFFQQRIGRRNRFFTLIKFRTLSDNHTLPPQARQFPLGSLLRMTSLDELPQLWNVLKGEMSLIGPRPLLAEYLPLFSSEEQARHSIRPGITGLAQVSGKNSIPWSEKFKYDLYYIGNISFWLDLKILVKTLALLGSFKRDKSLQEKKFTGNA